MPAMTGLHHAKAPVTTTCDAAACAAGGSVVGREGLLRRGFGLVFATAWVYVCMWGAVEGEGGSEIGRGGGDEAGEQTQVQVVPSTSGLKLCQRDASSHCYSTLAPATPRVLWVPGTVVM